LTPGGRGRGRVEVRLNFDAYPVQASLGVLGRKWAFLILMNVALSRARRFNDMLRTAPGMGKRILAIRLSELERDGFLEKAVRPDGRSEWTLAAKGVDVLPLLLTLVHYSSKWRDKAAGTASAMERLAPTFRVVYARAPRASSHRRPKAELPVARARRRQSGRR
jgi:DNA-binding HxlR family transcriptional regulator